ncbi:MAG: BatA domain-containing protein [Candidatus Zixiibacteriota bacterium]|nr:MAG: BatA domain-containing protein [candidate division Zixibacteria bacterium]
MLSFLNTTVLIAAVAALIPLIIHLFSRRKVRIIEFSSLKHLKAMQRRQVRRLKIRQLLLLILRMLIILLVVMAFARPTAERGSVGSHASVSAVILFDNSASMNRYVSDGILFDIARRRTLDLLQNFGEADEVDIVPLAGGDEREVFPSFTSAAIATDRLGQLENRHSRAEMNGALDHAASLLRQAHNLNREVYFVTDRQRHSLPDSGFLSGTGAVAFSLELPLEDPDNCGIVAVDFGGQLIIPGHDFTITARVKNYGENDRNDVLASLSLDGNRSAQADFSVAAGEETEVKFTRSVAYTGFHSGYIEISDDKYPGDNRYYFSFRIPERMNLLIIDGDGTGQLLSLALSPSQNINQYWSVKETTPDNLAGINFWDYDVVFLAGAPVLGATYIQRLKAFVGQGKSLFISYGSLTDTAYFNSAWSSLTGVTYDKPAPRDISRAGYYALSSFDAGHPIFSVFNFEAGAFPEIKFYALPAMHVSDTARVLMRFTGDRPALVESSFGNGRVLTFTGPIDARYSDLTGHAFFVPLVSRMAEFLAADLSSYDVRLFCGDNISRSIAVKSSIASSLYLISPDSSQYALVPEDRQGSLALRISTTDLPGIYSVKYLGREIDRFALNVNPDECDLYSVDMDQFAAAVGVNEINQLDLKADMAGALSEFRFGRELWHIFIWVAVILFALEMLLSRGSTAEEA